MAEKKNILTYAGLKQYEDELHNLKVFKRQEVAQKIKEAREQGDLSENAEYDAAKDEQRDIELRIEELEKLLKNALDALADQYDFIFIDCPPSLELLTVNALCAAHSLLVPVQCEYYALEGLSDLLATVRLVKRISFGRIQSIYWSFVRLRASLSSKFKV